jgi:ABC-type transport system involved in multi-copper enzyme maturation permease subunit
MPFLAILRHDLRALAGSWLVRVWLAAALLLSALLAATTWRIFPTAPMIALLLFPWLVFPWFVIVMVLGVNPISGSRAEPLADGFLSRPITRYEYLLGIWAARVVLVVGVYLVVTLPAIAVLVLANRSAPADHITCYGVLAALAVVAVVLTLQVSLAFLMGTLLRRALPAVVVLLFVWYPINLTLHTFRLESFSPITLSQALPSLLRQHWSEDAAAEKDLQLEAITGFFSSLAGGGPQEAPARRASFFEREEYTGISLWRVLCGYGIPALAAIGLATVCFCRRDL